MAMLVLGLIIFLGLHSTRILAESGREKAIARLGEGPWKGIYSLLSVIGFVLIVWGFADARWTAPALWTPLPGARHLTITLMLVAMVLLAAYFFKQSHITAAVHHPMVWSVAVFGLAHLIANGSAADARAVRRVPRLGCGRPRELLRPRPPQRPCLSRAQVERDERRNRCWNRALGRNRFLAALLAVRRRAARRIGRKS